MWAWVLKFAKSVIYNLGMPSIFSRIISGDLPAVKVHENESTLVIMDINPIQPGQLLVIPKVEVGTVWELSSLDYHALMDSVQKAGQSILRQFPGKKVGVMIEGLEITDHAHVKVFPFASVAEYHASPDPKNQPTQEELQQLASKLAFS